MATDHPIPPFPADIDRVGFGHWLSGFTDGEGCFRLGHRFHVEPTRAMCQTEFGMGLRADDRPILELIRSFLQCGKIYGANCSTIGHPQIYYRVTRARVLQSIVVPHFEAFPLRAKKRADFEIWKQGIAFVYRMNRRRRVGRIGAGNRLIGTARKWTESDKQEFIHLCESLKANRAFDMAGQITPTPVKPDDDQLLMF